MKNEVELTILMPCLNEEMTIGTCIKKAKKFLKKNKVVGEILIVDNGSTDNSVNIAEKLGVRVIFAEKKGYGNALIAGTKNAYGKYVIMGDSDDSYDFLNLELFLEKLRQGNDLVMGNRFAGKIERGAMPFLHRYVGNPILSFIGRLFYKSKVKDFHCGLRGYNRQKILNLNLKCGGMEYASEMIVKAEINNLLIAEVPTNLKKDGRNRKPHLNTFRDGWRHLKFLFVNAPNWLFFVPGIILMIIGFIGIFLLINGNFQISKDVSLGIHSMLYCSSFVLLGFEICIFTIFDKIYSYKVGLIINLDTFTKKIIDMKIYKVVIVGVLFLLVGIIIGIISFLKWKFVNFGDINATFFMPKIIISNLLLITGIQIVFSAFLINIMNVDVNNN